MDKSSRNHPCQFFINVPKFVDYCSFLFSGGAGRSIPELYAEVNMGFCLFDYVGSYKSLENVAVCQAGTNVRHIRGRLAKYYIVTVIAQVQDVTVTGLVTVRCQ